MFQLRTYQSIDQSLPSSVDDHDRSPRRQTRVVFESGSLSAWWRCDRRAILTAVGLSAVVVLVALATLGGTPLQKENSPEPVVPEETSIFDAQGRYIMRDFDKAKPMSNFLSGIAGVWGVPLWVFYVNRGQGVTSFGVNNKDGGILKFETADHAYQQTAFSGFRTFLKGKRQGIPEWTYQPFFPDTGVDCGVPTAQPQRDMMIGMNEMEIQEVESSLGLRTNALYFIIPEEDFGGLVRRVTFSNINPDSDLELDVLDGLSKLEPFGVSLGALNQMGRTMEGWMKVYNVDNGDFTRPFFHVTMSVGDVAQVQLIEEGHFVIAFLEGDDAPLDDNKQHELLPFIVDPLVVFGTDTTLTSPREFFTNSDGVDGLLSKPQGTTSRTPCAFTAAKLRIPAGKNVTLTSIYGHANNLEEFLENITPVLRKSGFVTSKRARAKQVVDEIAVRVATNTSSKLLNEYIKMDFVDNTLRGGLPLQLGDPASPKIFHTFSRIHGDIERDYNWFQLDMTYYSQGPGNFRDVNQNRRLDVQLVPAVGDFDLRMFLSFVQMDGYNPLTVASTNFKIPDDKLDATMTALKLSSKDCKKAKPLLKKPFRPGKLFLDLRAAGVRIQDKEAFLQTVVAASKQEFAAQYAQNGFWSDHWTYTLDLLESYLSIFPDREEHVLWDSQPVPFFVSPAVVKPRKDRYVLLPDKKQVRAYNAVAQWGEPGFPKAREDLLLSIYNGPDYIADASGAGGVWHRDKHGNVCTVSAIAKFAMLAIIKFSTLDPYGMGVEMEGGKPGWNDAMNGLPGLLGSSMPETYEMLRIVDYVRKVLPEYSRPVVFPSEFSSFMENLDAALDEYSDSPKDKQADFEYWNATNNAREEYRDQIVDFVKCKPVEWKCKDLRKLLDKIHDKTTAGIERALELNHGMPPTYFYFDMVKHADVSADDEVMITAEEFEVTTLPDFLEGPARYLKVAGDTDKRRQIYEAVRSSDLFDDELKMFKICVNLAGLSPEVGRMVAFAPGWLENESIWLHMSYKFLLELIRAGLFDEFYREIQVGLVPYMDNEKYGRSPLEAASFIVSSAFEDKRLHGQGYLARLSGSTAEFLSMWSLMMTGPAPFSLSDEGKLQLTLQPALAVWLFNEDDTLSFTWLSRTMVTYRNPQKMDTWQLKPCAGTIVTESGETVESKTGVFEGKAVEQIRDLEVKSISIDLCKA